MKYTPQVVTSQDEPYFVPEYKHPATGVRLLSHYFYPPEVNPLADRVFPDGKTHRWKVAPPKSAPSFKKVKRDRLIKMTPYSVGEIKEEWHLASIPRFASVGWSLVWSPVCHQKVAYGWIVLEPARLMTTYYDDQYDIIRAVDTFPTVEYTQPISPDDIQLVLNDLKADVVQKSYSGFDALTELAEFPETLGMLISLFKLALRPLQGIKALQEKYKRARARGKTHKQAHDDLSSEWMQYRYGIMPLVYSIQDLVKLLDEAFAEFKTDRAFSVLTSKPKNVPSSESHVAIYRSHEIRVSAIAKAKYSLPSLRLSDLITTNLFVTAWELIPFSFVIDWFINVGDVISSRTSGMMDLAQDRKFCYSIKRTTIDKHVLNYKFLDGVHFVRVHDQSITCKGGNVPFIQRFELNNSKLNMGSALLYSRYETSYERVIFQPDDVDLKFDPNLNWMRSLDAYVLSLNTQRKLFKKLR